MASSPEFVCWTTIRKIDWGATLFENKLLPRYTQFGSFKEYVGLCEGTEEAWYTRVLPKHADADPADFFIVKVIFSTLGFMKFSTETYRPGTPCFHKAIYSDRNEWGAWRFYGGIPLNATDLGTGESLVRIELVSFF